MGVNDGGGQGQEPGTNGGTQGQEPNQQGQQQQGGNGGQGQESGNQGGQQGNQFDPSTIEDPAIRAWAEKVAQDAREAREQAAKYRTERNTYQQQVQQHQQANETAEQKAERERAELQAERDRLATEVREIRVGSAAQQAAEKAQAFNPATVYGLIKDRIQVNDEGAPTNLDSLVADLKRTDPYLFKRVTADAGAGQDGGTVPQDMNAAIRRMAGRNNL